MSVKVWINGAIREQSDATVSVFDRGFLYGDSVYEVLRTAGGRPVDLDPHLTRLARSAQRLALPFPAAKTLRSAIATTLAAACNDESYLRIVLTRGEGEIGLDLELATDPSVIVIVRPLRLPDAVLYERGAALQIVGIQRTSPKSVDPAVKSGNYLNSILALAEARKAGADEALMCDAAGRVAEGSTSNVFVARAGSLVTPAAEVGLLQGITRARVLELASEAGIDASEGPLRPDDVRAAEEVFITSSIRGIVPIATVDGAPVGRACPGPIALVLMQRYAAYLVKVAADA